MPAWDALAARISPRRGAGCERFVQGRGLQAIGAARRARERRHIVCTTAPSEETAMYYGIGATVLIILVVLFLLGRL